MARGRYVIDIHGTDGSIGIIRNRDTNYPIRGDELKEVVLAVRRYAYVEQKSAYVNNDADIESYVGQLAVSELIGQQPNILFDPSEGVLSDLSGVYIAQHKECFTDCLKIGQSDNILERMNTLQAQLKQELPSLRSKPSVLCVIPEADSHRRLALEKALHLMFHHQRYHEEWFVRESVQWFIEQLRNINVIQNNLVLKY